MAANKVNFTKAQIDALPAAEPGKRATWFDSKTPGLCVIVTERGSKSFYVYRKVNGKPERIRIGSWPDLSIEQVRKKAAEINGQIAVGEDPQEKRRQLRADCTFAELFAWYIEHHAKVHKVTWTEDEEKFRNHLGPIAGRKVSKLTRTDIRTLHAEIGTKAGPYAANRTLALVRSVFNKGIKAEVVRVANPAMGIDTFPERERDRRLMPSELPTFIKAVLDDPNEDVHDFFLLLLYTGVRRSNLQAMRWEEVDILGTIWRIPNTKNQTPQTIPLGGEELEILKRRKAKATGPWVFPGRGKTGHMAEPQDAWERICQRAGITNLRMHDLRRTLGSWMVDTGASLPIIGKTLNHMSPQSTQIYARLSLDPVREAKGRAIAAMISTVKQ